MFLKYFSFFFFQNWCNIFIYTSLKKLQLKLCNKNTVCTLSASVHWHAKTWENTCMWRSSKEALRTPQRGRRGDQTQTPIEEGLFLWVQLLFWPDHMVQPAAKTSQAQFERPRFPWSDRRCRPRKIPADNPFHARLKLQHSHTPRCSYYTAPSLSLHSLMQLLFPRLSRLGTGGGAGMDSCLLLVLTTVALLPEVSCHDGGGKLLQQWWMWVFTPSACPASLCTLFSLIAPLPFKI